MASFLFSAGLSFHTGKAFVEIIALPRFLALVLIQRTTQPGSTFLAPPSLGESPMNVGSVKSMPGLPGKIFGMDAMVCTYTYWPALTFCEPALLLTWIIPSKTNKYSPFGIDPQLPSQILHS